MSREHSRGGGFHAMQFTSKAYLIILSQTSGISAATGFPAK